jgi:hypothetical protein
MHERSLPCPKYYLVSLHTETDITGTGSYASARQAAGPTNYRIDYSVVPGSPKKSLVNRISERDSG